MDGYVVGPNDGPGTGLGEGGERLHYWVFGGPWSYADEPTSEATGVDKQYLDEANAHLGAVVAGRNMYDAAEAWGGSNPWDVPMFVVTHRTEDAPPADTGFTFVNGFDDASRRPSTSRATERCRWSAAPTWSGRPWPPATSGAHDHDRAGDAGRRQAAVRGFDRSIDLEQTHVLHSSLATHITYRVLA